jgi:hypothetical protein
MSIVTTNRDIDLTQLAAELATAAGLTEPPGLSARTTETSVGSETVVHCDHPAVTQMILDDAIDAHVPIQAPARVESQAAVIAVAAMVVRARAEAGDLTEAEAVAVAPAFPVWAPGEPVAPGDLRYRQGALVEAIQAHTTQVDWAPEDTPALWKTFRDPAITSPWKQPAGAHDAYAKGATVTHNGKTWTSNVDGNVWAPPTQWTQVP